MGIRSAKNASLPMISLCHGPAALCSSALGGDFAYKGYKICVFPDKMDEASPSYGYLPGKLTADKKHEVKLTQFGCLVQNKEMDDSACIDRELITGASQLASQNVSELAVKMLAERYQFKA